jgi:hypothetical protein
VKIDFQEMQWLHLQEFLSMINIEGTAISLQISPQNLTLVLPVKCLRYIQRERECDYCKFDGKKTEAVSLCLECKDDMCNNCADAHRKTKITRLRLIIVDDCM